MFILFPEQVPDINTVAFRPEQWIDDEYLGNSELILSRELADSTTSAGGGMDD